MLHRFFLQSSLLTELRSLPTLVRVSLSILALACCATYSASTHAGLVPGGGDLDNDLNNALRFDPSTPTPVKVAYKDASLPVDRFIQVGFSTTNSAAFSVSAIAWSRDNITFQEFQPNNFVDGVVSGGSVKYSSVIDLGAPIGGTSSTPFYLRYTLPAGIDMGALVQSAFRANSNGSTSNGILSDEITNGFVSLTRLHTAVPEPTSLLLLSSVGAWGIWRRVKRSK